MTSLERGKFRPWDVVLVPLPYTEKTASKLRPAVVVSSEDLLQATRLYFVAMVTNAEHAAWAGDVPVSNLATAGLPIPSIIRSARLATIDEAAIIRSLGSLATADRVKVASEIRAFLA
jgi:mRNA-degrading endonuclease toxin of MazEF toxin-antitoxin module